MTAYDARARATAGRKLAPISAGGSGQAVTISTTTPGTRDLATGRSLPASTTTQAGSGIDTAYAAFLVDGTLVKAGDRKFMLSPLTTSGGALVLPTAGDRLTDAAGKVWSVISVEVFAPASLLVYAILQLRLD